MTRATAAIDRFGVPAAGLFVCALGLVPELLGISTPKLRAAEVLTVASGASLMLARLLLKWRPAAAFEAALKSADMSARDLWVMLVVSVVTFAVCDVGLRRVLPPTYVATRYGWQTQPDSVLRHVVTDAPGRVRDVTVRYVKNGFKKWGDVGTSRYKIFVIGDSFTEMDLVSSGEEWYSHLGEKLGLVEWFVYGGGGYGSLQEYMVLDDYVDVIRPDAILWQFCNNDYDNNLYALDLASYPYNNYGVRPYFEQGHVVYRLPLPFAAVRAYSFFGDRLLKLYDRFNYRRTRRDLEAYRQSRAAEKQSEGHRRLMNQSVAVTQEILAMASRRVGKTPILLFNACSNLSPDEVRICSAVGITCLPGVSEYVIAQEHKGLVTRIPNDGHWNSLGNRFAADILAGELTTAGVRPGRSN